MRIADQIQLRDSWTNRQLRAGEAFMIKILNIIQKFYNEDGHRFKWLQDDKTQIWIGTMDAFGEVDPGGKPAIVGKRGQVGFTNVGGVDKMRAQNRKIGSKTYMDQISSIVTLNCIDTNMTTSEDIGLELFELFGYIRPMLHEEGFQNFKGPTLMETSKLSGSVRPGSWTTPLQISGNMQITWEVTPDAPELKAINVKEIIR